MLQHKFALDIFANKKVANAFIGKKVGDVVYT
jgi:hypothetical protein